MAQAPLTDAEKRATIAALQKAKGRRTYAASIAGVKIGTFRSRIAALGRDPKWASKVLPPPPTAASVESADPTVSTVRAERRIRFLEGQVERLRAVDVKPVKPAKKRSGKDDTLLVAFPDVHGSHQDRAAVAAFLADLKRLGPDEVYGLGDLADCGGFLAQHHVMGYVAETEYTFEQDTADASAFLESTQEASGGTLRGVLEGNHDRRPETWAVTAALRNRVDAEFLRKRVAVAEVLRLKERGIGYYKRDEYYDGLSVQGTIKRGKLLLTHGLQRGGGGPGLNAGARMLQRFGTNVAFGHYHRVSQLIERDASRGTIGAFNLGCLCKLQPLYAHADPTSWNHGYGIFVMARSGNFLPITVPIINGVSLLPEIKL